MLIAREFLHLKPEVLQKSIIVYNAFPFLAKKGTGSPIAHNCNVYPTQLTYQWLTIAVRLRYASVLCIDLKGPLRVVSNVIRGSSTFVCFGHVVLACHDDLCLSST